MIPVSTSFTTLLLYINWEGLTLPSIATPFPRPVLTPLIRENVSSKIAIFPAKSGSCLHFHVRTSQIKKANNQSTNLTHLNIDMGIPLWNRHIKFWWYFDQIWVRFPPFCDIWLNEMFFLTVFKRRYLNLTDNLAHQSESVKEKAKEEFHGKFKVFRISYKVENNNWCKGILLCCN